jgi:hypothetical protein
MRLAKPAAIAFGLAAASGVALVLSGSASAADSSLGTASGTNSQPGAPVQQQVGQQNTDSTQTATNANSDQSKSSDVSQTDGRTDSAKPVAADPSAPGPGAGAMAVKVVISSSVPVVGQAPDPAASRPVPSVASAPAQSAQPAVSQAASEAEAKAADSDQPVPVYRTAVLPLQPTIIAREGQISDLASTVPTPPKPDKAPVPAKSSGALGKLTAELAGVVVPQLFALPALMGTRLPAMPGLGVLILVMLPVFVFSYGLWLRRGGFATAARSDSPARAAVLYLLHQPWVMPQRRRAKRITHFLVSELAGVHVMGAA